MGLIPAIVAWLLSAGSSVVELAKRVGNSFSTLWDTLTGFFTELAQAAGHITGGAIALFNSLGRFGVALAMRLPYILFVFIPDRITIAIGNLVSWTVEYVEGKIQEALAVINAVRDWVTGQLAGLFNDVRALGSQVWAQINDIIGVLNWVRDHVVQLLTDPTVLARWLLGALFSVAKDWIEANTVALARWALGVAVSGTIRAAGIIEDILVKII